MSVPAFIGLDLLSTAVMVIDETGVVKFINTASETLFGLSSRSIAGVTLDKLFASNATLRSAIRYAIVNKCAYTEHDVELGIAGRGKLHLSCTASPIELEGRSAGSVLIEFRHIEQQLRIAREERMLNQSVANRELIRNLAHEIKNPLGGIRGAAQLLDRELDRPELHEYTQVIMNEADRLQSLMDRLLTPHRLPQPTLVNVHEVLERVRSVMLAEFPAGLSIRRDYDTSLPQIKGDREQLIQAVLNVVRNAAQSMHATRDAVIRLRTRIARQVTLARRRYRHAIEIAIIDNGPGIPDAIRERLFYPLVSGREGGSGLGLTLAQTFVSQHHGTITFESVPGDTRFIILLPVEVEEPAPAQPQATAGRGA